MFQLNSFKLLFPRSWEITQAKFCSCFFPTLVRRVLFTGSVQTCTITGIPTGLPCSVQDICDHCVQEGLVFPPCRQRHWSRETTQQVSLWGACPVHELLYSHVRAAHISWTVGRPKVVKQRARALEKDVSACKAVLVASTSLFCLRGWLVLLSEWTWAASASQKSLREPWVSFRGQLCPSKAPAVPLWDRCMQTREGQFLFNCGNPATVEHLPCRVRQLVWGWMGELLKWLVQPACWGDAPELNGTKGKFLALSYSWEQAL